MTSARRAGEPHALLHDTRGALVLIGIAAAAIAAMALYHMSGVASAIAWRENIQSAADSAAFTSAVYNAQGMNAMVALNIIMAVAMAVLIAWRILLIGATFLAVLLFGLSFIPGMQWAAGASLRVGHWAERAWTKTDPKVSEKVVKICSGINALEKLVSTAAPAIAMAESMRRTWVDYDANWVLTLTPSLALPPAEELKAKGLKQTLSPRNLKDKITECFQRGKSMPSDRRYPSPPYHVDRNLAGHHGPMHTWTEVSQRRMGLIFSLPAQEDHLGKLCSKSGNILDPVVAKWAKGTVFEEFWGHFSKFKGELFGSVPSLFCSPMTARSTTDGLDSMLEREAKDQCVQIKKEYKKLPDEERKKHKFYSATHQRGSRADYNGFDRTKCEKDVKDSAKKKYNSDTRRELDNALECVKPARVWEPSRNGNLFMQSFAWVNISELRPKNPLPKEPPVMRAPDSPPPPPSISAPPELVRDPPKTVRAQAEMYFDCKDKWIKCDLDAMWKFKWKAHLHYVQSAEHLANEAVSSALAAGIALGAQEIFVEKIFNGQKNISNPGWYGADVKHGTSTNHLFYPLQEALRDLFMDTINVMPPRTIH